MVIPRCMSTQHPDNVTLPFFVNNSVLSGDDEVQEAYYVYSHLGIKEQMWDAEGKDVDNHVVKKLLTKYDHFFRTQMLGKDVRLTLRIPNPGVEKNEAKIVAETLESIPRSFDVAKNLGYKDSPIFEVILPMTRDAREIERVYSYYKNQVIGQQHQKVHDITVKEWIGEFHPESIQVIPLVEDKESLLSVNNIVEPYLKGKKLEHQRVFLARSDPALNYGMLSAVLLNKCALSDLELLEKKTSVEMLPIIGVGSVPFRGNFSPENINCLKGYPSAQTFTVQSAFKYDYPVDKVRKAVGDVNETKRGKAIAVDKKWCMDIIERTSARYVQELSHVMPALQLIAKHIPKRRARKLHIGLFGYSRGVGEFQLPRAITFCASLYSLGIVPEMLGLSALSGKDYEQLESGVYKNMKGDVAHALQYVNMDAVKTMTPALATTAKNMLKQFDVDVNQEHKEVTDSVLGALKKEQHAELHDAILRAGMIRKFLG